MPIHSDAYFILSHSDGFIMLVDGNIVAVVLRVTERLKTTSITEELRWVWHAWHTGKTENAMRVHWF